MMNSALRNYRNIEKVLDCKVLDRNNLILDIFAGRARTAHAKTQVELAQYEYLLPRLTRMWTHLSKQKGGIGMKGPGETEIETDRRIIRDRISLLKKKLIQIDKQKATQRKNRGKHGQGSPGRIYQCWQIHIDEPAEQIRCICRK